MNLHQLSTDEICEYDEMFEQRLDLYQDENGEPTQGHDDDYHSLYEAYLRDECEHEPWFPGEE